ncbi:response regulator [Streptomyces brasiliensis]|uniref:DNA-binding response regulator n=1 Tax=Streptomyces brasiliensis TaxID=1954 RepID=A0A917K1M6_9ACTN|nr:response regulator transcription factor [Streptomyces brasiliensis]GGI95019.1 DNA-binding response regulator [Streptomyces brasiliensis]
MTHILVVDDEPHMLKVLQIHLQAHRYTVDTAADGPQALVDAISNPPDAVILDLGLPQIDGHQVLQALRAWSQMPVIVLSGRSDADEKVATLDAGADDYVTKPFVMNELLARLRAVLRRPSTQEPSHLIAHIGEWTIDLTSSTVHRADGDGAQLRLTPTEWSILHILLRHPPGRLVTSRQILRQVWGPEHENKTNYLRIYFASLRRKLEPDPASPRHLLTEPGMGYRFEP